MHLSHPPPRHNTGVRHDNDRRWREYKIRIPCYGCIILNEDNTKAILVKGWKASSGWSFPKGKINKDEKEEDCAARCVR